MITEERLFAPNGKHIATCTTPHTPDLAEYRHSLGHRIAQEFSHQYQGQPGVCFRLVDGRTLIVLLDSDA